MLLLDPDKLFVAILQHVSLDLEASSLRRTLKVRALVASSLNSSILRSAGSRSSSGGGVGVRGMISKDLSASC